MLTERELEERRHEDRMKAYHDGYTAGKKAAEELNCTLRMKGRLKPSAPTREEEIAVAQRAVLDAAAQIDWEHHVRVMYQYGKRYTYQIGWAKLEAKLERLGAAVCALAALEEKGDGD